MGLYQYGYGMRVDDDLTLTIEDITQGIDVSDAAIFASATADTQYGRALPFSNVNRFHRPTGNSDADILRSVLVDEAPTRPFAGRRSQHDRD